ncbi:TPA: hypothetical protein H1008_01280 [archaeon]|nr:hypothetical protein [Candidatus Undinarchaeales archaeon SRR5007147.bin71]
MERCSFCGTEIERGTGKILVKKDGSLLYFCSNKCDKNLLKLGRNPVKFGWTRKYQKAKGRIDIAAEVRAKSEAQPKKEKGKPPRSEAEVVKEKSEEKKEDKKQEQKEERKND